jgi:hypothetical protein
MKKHKSSESGEAASSEKKYIAKVNFDGGNGSFLKGDQVHGSEEDLAGWEEEGLIGDEVELKEEQEEAKEQEAERKKLADEDRRTAAKVKRENQSSKPEKAKAGDTESPSSLTDVARQQAGAPSLSGEGDENATGQVGGKQPRNVTK